MLDCGVARSSQQQSALRTWLLQPLQVSVCPVRLHPQPQRALGLCRLGHVGGTRSGEEGNLWPNGYSCDITAVTALSPWPWCQFLALSHSLGGVTGVSVPVPWGTRARQVPPAAMG